jgi:hypothetical protein
VENAAMMLLREKIGGRTAAAPTDVASMLDEGLVEEDGCLFLAYFARRDHSPRSSSEDEIGFEAFYSDTHSLDLARRSLESTSGRSRAFRAPRSTSMCDAMEPPG